MSNATSDTELYPSQEITGFADREPFMASATATKRPKADKPMESSFFGRLFGSRKSEAELGVDSDLAQLETKREHVKQLADEHRRLTLNRDNAKKKLALADGQFESLKTERDSILQRARNVWGEVNPYGPPWAAYSAIHSIDTAAAAFPEVRKPLVKALADEEAALAAFRKLHGLVE